jgi:hypothetical protein
MGQAFHEGGRGDYSPRPSGNCFPLSSRSKEFRWPSRRKRKNCVLGARAHGVLPSRRVGTPSVVRPRTRAPVHPPSGRPTRPAPGHRARRRRSSNSNNSSRVPGARTAGTTCAGTRYHGVARD